MYNNIINKRLKINTSLKSKLIITYMCLSFFSILLISSITYFISKNTLTNKISSLSNNLSIQTKLNVDSYLSEIENATSLVFAHDNILVFNPSRSNLNSYDIEKTKREIDEYLLSVSLLQNFTDFALVYDDGTTIGKISETTNKLYDTNSIYSDLKDAVKDTKSKSTWISGKNGNYNKLFYIKQVNDNSLMLTSIYTYELDEIFEKLNDGNGSSLTLLNTSNDIIYSNNKDLIGQKVEDEISHKINNNSSKIFTCNNSLVTLNTCNNGWKLINSIPENYIFKEIHISQLIIIIIAILCMIASGLLGLLFAKKISTPILEIVNEMKKAENGDLTVQATVSSNDEIGILCSSFNNMINHIRELINNTLQASNIVSNESFEIKNMSEQTFEIADSVSKAMEDIANGSYKQSTELNTTLKIMENLAHSINSIIDNIENATLISNNAKKTGDNSLTLIKELQLKNENTNKLMEKINLNIVLLTNSIKEIENVIDLINSINEQTNLLSLNASIEAARAGESGKGFAIVAEEVRKLADQSKESTENVHKVIKNIYDNAKTTINLVETSKTVFKDQSDAVNYANNSFVNIIDSTEKITSYIKTIEQLMKKINIQKDETLKSTNNIKLIAETSSANTEEVLAATQEQTASAQDLEHRSDNLTSTAQLLADSLNKFKI
ncbi:MAG: methyl-accepting chemotaxis protein [Clostridium butyricum]|nr:methyl-accepting chemotaxis protein [Clostridium butyricum]